MKNPNLRPRLVNLRRGLVPLSHRKAPTLTTEPSTLPSNVQNWKNPNLRPRLVNLCRSLPLSHREGSHLDDRTIDIALECPHQRSLLICRPLPMSPHLNHPILLLQPLLGQRCHQDNPHIDHPWKRTANLRLSRRPCHRKQPRSRSNHQTNPRIQTDLQRRLHFPLKPSSQPSNVPSTQPSLSAEPSSQPSSQPTDSDESPLSSAASISVATTVSTTVYFQRPNSVDFSLCKSKQPTIFNQSSRV